MSAPLSAAEIAHFLSGRSANDISLEIRALIRAGTIPVGSRLPPVRDLAAELGVSPGTVATAWGRLTEQRILIGKGRNGTWVAETHSTALPERFASIGSYGADVLNLHMAVPDDPLLPPLGAALAHAAAVDRLNSYHRDPILPELKKVVAPRWPYAPEAFMATNGGYSAVHTILNSLSLAGARVAIESPTALRHLDILEAMGATILAVECDENGPLPQSLEAVCAQKPMAFLFQPRLHSVTGLNVSPDRLEALAQVVARHDLLVIEDDGLGELSSLPPQSIGRWHPEKVVHVLSFSKTHGPDLRLAVVSGTQQMLTQLANLRSFNSGWTSRILQSATAWLLNDAETQARVARARDIYIARRRGLCDALAAQGVTLPRGEGLSAWLPVGAEQFAVVTMAAHNIAVSPGSRFTMGDTGHIRLATALAPGREAEVARALALAAAAP